MPKISDLPTDTAPASTDLIPFVDVDAARTESVTVANLAASTAFAGQYLPLTSGLGVRPVAGAVSYWPVPDAIGASGSNAALPTQGVMYLQPFIVVAPLTLTSISAEVTTAGEASAVLRMGVYSDVGPNHAPLTFALVADFSTVAANTTGIKTVTSSVALSPGLYWVGVVPQVCPTTAPQLRGHFDNFSLPGVPLADLAMTRGTGAILATGVTGALPASPAAVGSLGNADRRAMTIRLGVAAG